MRRYLKICLAVCILSLSVLACTLPLNDDNSPTPGNIDDMVATAAAATLTAMAPDPHGDVTIEAATPTVPETTSIPDPIMTEEPGPLSPSELRVSYVDKNGNLWAWAEGTSPALIVNTGDINTVQLSPDGEWVVFERISADYIESSLWAIRFNGSEEHLLISHADFMSMPLHPDISADSVVGLSPYLMKFVPGTYTLAFNTSPKFEGPGLFINNDLWLVDVISGARSPLLAPGQAGNFYYNPDGSQMALVTPTEISLINSDGSNRRNSVLLYSPVSTYSEYAYYAEPLWSPDGSFLRVLIPPQDFLGDPSATTQIYQIPIDGSPASLLGNLPTAPLRYGDFSPNLNRIAYVQQVGEPADNLYSLNFANFDGSGSAEFTRGSFAFESWSTDSNHFAFIDLSSASISTGEVGSVGSLALDVSPATRVSWISADRYLFIYQGLPEPQLRMGTIGLASTSIANLGSGDKFPQYDFVTP
jgi:hypothetical protein